MKCLKCNAKIAEDSKFCPICGEKVDVEIICPNCGTIVERDAKFCHKCGRKIERKYKCPECGAEIKDGNKFCHKCGRKIDAGCVDDESFIGVNTNLDMQDKPELVAQPETIKTPIATTITTPIVQESDDDKLSCFDVKAYNLALKKAFIGVTGIYVSYAIFAIVSTFAIIYLGSESPLFTFVKTTIFIVIGLAFYVYYVIGLGDLSKSVDRRDFPAVNKMRNSAIMFAIVPMFFIMQNAMSESGSNNMPLIGLMGMIWLSLFVVSVVFRFIGLVKLKKSKTFPGKEGAKIVFIATILLLCLPIVVLFFGLAFGEIAGFIMIIYGITSIVISLIGWKKMFLKI